MKQSVEKKDSGVQVSKLHPLVAAIELFKTENLPNLPFVHGTDVDAEGWYIWRLNADTRVDDYEIKEVFGGHDKYDLPLRMSDLEVIDSYGTPGYCEPELYGEFFGPIMLR